MRISDWSSDVCSSDLLARHLTPFGDRPRGPRWREAEPRDPRGRIVDLLPIAEARHHRAIVLPPSKARASAHLGRCCRTLLSLAHIRLRARPAHIAPGVVAGGLLERACFPGVLRRPPPRERK